ncbi:two-component regulator propeller domain-containing protein [Spirosoma soli]|uniref:histidine kinase n=1 Tax=Spirosoma soli TaxID=1770529 RepID=A0ABW5MAX1_9BACT
MSIQNLGTCTRGIYYILSTWVRRKDLAPCSWLLVYYVGLCWAFVTHSTGASAQAIANTFDHLSVKDGLSHSSVNCILQDREGFMWFGTHSGLNKYDGYTFTVFQPDPTNPARSFLNNRIMGLCEDRDNRLWAVTEGGGLHEINKKTGQVTPHPIQTHRANRWNNQLSVYQDHQGILWVSAYDGLARYNPETHHFQLYPSPQPETPVKSVFEDRQRRLWVATAKGLYQFDRKTGRFSLLAAPTAIQPVFNSFYLDDQNMLWLGSASDGVFQLNLRRRPLQLVGYNPEGKLNRYVYLNAVQRDAQGVLWVGTTEGLQRVDVNKHQVTTYRPNSTASTGLSSKDAQAIYHDRTGTLWIGTNNGIDRQVRNTKPFVVYQIEPATGTANLPQNRVNVVLVDNESRLWLSNQQVVYRMSPQQNQPDVVPSQQLGVIGQHGNSVSSFLADGSAGIWLGSWDGLYRFDALQNRYIGYPSEIHAQFLSRGSTGDVWIGGEGGIASFNPHTLQYRYYKYNPADTAGLPDKFVYSILASRTGDVWVGVNGKGISRLNPKTGRFTHYPVGTGAGQLNNSEVLAFYEDEQGIIWVGTNQGGLNRLDPRTGVFTHITTQDGLPTNHISAIVSDKSGRLWLGTSRGLCRFDPRTKAVRNYDSNDGLPSNEIPENAVCRHNSRLYFGTMNGLIHFDPDSVRDDTRPFPVCITGFKVLDQNRPLLSESVNLPYDENFLAFEFAALTYLLPEKNQYAYQLVGIDKTWVQSGSRRFASYPNLPPGNYTFRVKAANSDGIWNNTGTAVQIHIQPPWWATWWAYSVYALLFGGAVWAFIRFQTSRIRQRQEMELNRRQAEQLKAVDEVKTRFFSNITHEFRTPLSLIVSPLEKLLQGGRLEPSTYRTLSLVQRNAHQLLQLINQLLDLSKLEAGSMTASLKRGTIDEYVEPLVESFREAAEHKSVTLTYTAAGLKQDYLFDADKWGKILTNLLSNALKFTPAGGQITVTSHLLFSPTDEEPQVQIVVADTGIGIPAEHLPHVFDRFYQVDDSRTRAYEGTGIGLALVKELTELMKGTIGVESQRDSGTVFTLKLPVQIVQKDTHVSVAAVTQTIHKERFGIANEKVDVAVLPEPPVDESEQPVLLVVEDNTDLREFMTSELAVSYRVLSAVNGEEAWALTQVELPDIVISDVMMPVMDGYELTRLIKNDPTTDHIAVVLLTAKAAQDSRIEGLLHGADEYLTKPFSFHELNLRLRNLINRQQRLREEYSERLTRPDAPPPLESEQTPFMRQIYELLDQQLEDTTLSVDWLADKLAMSRKTLYRKIGGVTQLAPNELIRQYRLRKAADLLRTGHSVTETAYKVGFKTPSHFAKVFKELYGKTPTDFLLENSTDR